MIIRPAVEADLEGIAEAHVESWREAYVGLIPDWYTTALRAAGFTEVTLWVLEGNHRARRFYEAQG